MISPKEVLLWPVMNIKKSATTIFFLLLAAGTFDQSIDQQLAAAMHAKDTIKVEALLNNGADANYKEKMGGSNVGFSMLIFAVHNYDYKSVKLLVDHKAEVDWKDWFKTTALMYAASLGEADIVKYLIKNGADIRAHDEQGNSVLSAAKVSKNQDVIYLIEKLLKK